MESEEKKIDDIENDFDGEELDDVSELNTDDEMVDEQILTSNNQDKGPNEDFIDHKNDTNSSANTDSELNVTEEHPESDESYQQRIAYNECLQLISETNEYQLYIKLIELSRAMNDPQLVRKSFEIWSRSYPINSYFSLQWIDFEKEHCSTQDGKKYIVELHERSLHDYYCNKMAEQLAKYVLELSPEYNYEWDQLLSNYVYDFLGGGNIFKLWRQSIINSEISEEEQRKKIVNLYKKELAIPLADIEQTYVDFRVYCETKNITNDIDWEYLTDLYNRNKRISQIMSAHEKKLTDETLSTESKYNLYVSYINDKNWRIPDERILKTLYERMITDCCLLEDSWLTYLNYLIESYDKNSENKDTSKYDETSRRSVLQQNALDVVNRAIRNCSYSHKLCIEKIRILDIMEMPQKDVKLTFEESMLVINTPTGCVALWMEYLHYLRRHTNMDDAAECDILRRTFELAWETLSKQWSYDADENCEILKFWGRLEYGPLKNSRKGNELWRTAMDNGRNLLSSAFWVEFAELELTRNYKAARKVYRRAIVIEDIDDRDAITSAWMRLEMTYGSLKNLIMLEKAIKLIAETSAEMETEFTEELMKNKNDKETVPAKKRKIVDSDVDKKDNRSSSNKRVKVDCTQSADHVPVIDKTKDASRVFLSNLDYDITEEEIKAELPTMPIKTVEIVRSANGRGRGFAFVQLDSEDSVEVALKCDRQIVKGRPVFISMVVRNKDERPKLKYSLDVEPNKLFVKGFPLDTTNDDLYNLFSECGSLKEVRLVCHKNGKSKGIAYVVYQAETDASKAIEKFDNYVFKNSTISVKISAPPKVPIMTNIKPQQFERKETNTNQRPRLNLIPTVVRKAALNSKVTAQSTTEASLNTSPSTTNDNLATMKSNEDFRKLLLKK